MDAKILDKKEEYPSLREYGVIGNLETVALVSKFGSIDFLCAPDFDGDPVFCRLIDFPKGGYFAIRPVDYLRSEQLYLPDSCVLITRFFCREGHMEVTDWMPVGHDGLATAKILREVRCIRGQITMEVALKASYDYARQCAAIIEDRSPHKGEKQARFCIVEPEQEKPLLTMSSEIPLSINSDLPILTGNHCIRAGERLCFSLDFSALDHVSDGQDSEKTKNQSIYSYGRRENQTVDSLHQTLNFWRTWVRQCNYQARWSDLIHRSLMTLKLLISTKRGSIVAAPTFGLPEAVGEKRNWDYRYSWIRDSSLAIQVLAEFGYQDEAQEYLDWIECRLRESPQMPLQPLYGSDGSRQVEESTLPHLEGYRKSQPVRIGNCAYKQMQLDIYGDLLHTVERFDANHYPIHHGLWRDISKHLEWLSENWQKPDDGIWEFRSDAAPQLYTRLMCWVAFDRGIDLANRRRLPASLNRWRETAQDIYQNIHEKFWNDEIQAFVQTENSDVLDAACLRMPLVGFISPTDPRWVNTMQAIERDLVSGSLVFRYMPDQTPLDPFESHEGSFTACSFWYVQALAKMGRVEEAREHLEKTVPYANNLGLFSEQVGIDGELLGNFPQVLSHLALAQAIAELNQERNQRWCRL